MKNLTISDEILKDFASGILVSDVDNYVNKNKLEYEKWLNQKNNKNNNQSNSINKRKENKKCTM